MFFLSKKLCHQKLNNDEFLELETVKMCICQWYKDQSKKVQEQFRKAEFQESEQTNIYHHELHKTYINKGNILRLDTEQGILVGHESCAAYLEKQVNDLLGKPAHLDSDAQEQLLNLVSSVITREDNIKLEALPTKAELLSTLKSSNLNASGGSDGITGLVYKECWDALGDSLCDVVTAIFSGCKPTPSMRTAMMNFCQKPKKVNSLKPSDKRRISVLNCNFNLCEGILARRFRKIGDILHSLHQNVASKEKTIHHGIAKARAAINASMNQNLRCGIVDQDYIAAFDFLVLSLV